MIDNKITLVTGLFYHVTDLQPKKNEFYVIKSSRVKSAHMIYVSKHYPFILLV